MSLLIERFAVEYQAYHDIGEQRRKLQRRQLGLLEEQAGAALDQVTGDQLRAYVQLQVARGFAPSTVKTNLRAISPFFTWSFERGVIDRTRLRDLRDVKPPRGSNPGEPRPYTVKEVGKLWACIEAAYPYVDQKWIDRFKKGSSPWRRVRTHAQRLQMEAVVAIALYGGLRRDEIYGLDYQLMHHENAYVGVVGAAKNAEAKPRHRIVPMIAPLRDPIKRWFDFRADVVRASHDRPWCSLRAGGPSLPLGRVAFQHLLTRHGWEFHRLRHTAATQMLRADLPLEVVQKIMGHARLEQTLAYAKILDSDVLRVAARHEDRYEQIIGRMRIGQECP